MKHNRFKPGEFRDVDAPGGNLRDAFMPLPFKEPSGTLLNLMGVVVQAGQRFASIADLQVGEGNQQAAVGTTVALLERGSRTMSAIHKRLYASMKREFSLMARVFKLYLPPVYPYDVVGGQRQIKQTDFDDRIDILPVADPNIFLKRSGYHSLKRRCNWQLLILRFTINTKFTETCTRR